MRNEADCEQIRENLWRYIDRELSAPELASLSAHLKACPKCSRLYEERAREAKVYRLAFVDSPFGEHFVEAFRKRFDLETISAKGMDPTGKILQRRPSGLWKFLPEAILANPRRVLGRAALALALISIGASVFFGLRKGPVLGRIEATGLVKMTRGPGTLTGVARDLRPGDSFQLLQKGSELRLFLQDGTEVRLEGPAGFRIEESSRPAGSFRGWLGEGFLKALVKPRAAGRELVLETPHATTKVVGTEFTLQVTSSGTSLNVQEGLVHFKGVLDEVFQQIRPQRGTYLVALKEGKAVRAPVDRNIENIEEKPATLPGEIPGEIGVTNGGQPPASSAGESASDQGKPASGSSQQISPPVTDLPVDSTSGIR